MINFEYDVIEMFYFCPNTYRDYSCIILTNKKRFKFLFLFRCKYKTRERELIIFCIPCIDIFKEIFSCSGFFQEMFHSLLRSVKKGNFTLINELSLDGKKISLA